MLRVLIVHTDTDDRAMYADYLREHAMEVTEVSSTDAALAFAHLHHVLVTGLNVPGTFPATDLIARLRARRPNQRIVVVTASSQPGQHEAARQAGCDCLLMKPCLPSELLDAVRDLQPPIPLASECDGPGCVAQ